MRGREGWSRSRAATVGAAFGAALILCAGGAWAEGEHGKTEGAAGGTAATPGGTQAEGTRTMGPEETGHHDIDDEESEEGNIRVGIDWVGGTGKTNVANQTQPTTLGGGAVNSIENVQVTSQSFIAGASIEYNHKLEFGARLPLTYGQFNLPDGPARSTTAVGNLELEGVYAHHIDQHMELGFALGIALPTAQGTDVPDPSKVSSIVEGANGLIDQNAYDRGALNRAASSSRGWETTALFETQRFGIIPKVELEYHRRKLAIEPYVKLENLLDTSGGAEHKYIGELVIGGRIAYRLARHVEPGVRIWTNIPLTGTDDTAVAVVEPQIRFPFTNRPPTVGAILPFAGPLASPTYTLGVRVSVAARF